MTVLIWFLLSLVLTGGIKGSCWLYFYFRKWKKIKRETLLTALPYGYVSFKTFKHYYENRKWAVLNDHPGTLFSGSPDYLCAYDADDHSIGKILSGDNPFIVFKRDNEWEAMLFSNLISFIRAWYYIQERLIEDKVSIRGMNIKSLKQLKERRILEQEIIRKRSMKKNLVKW